MRDATLASAAAAAAAASKSQAETVDEPLLREIHHVFDTLTKDMIPPTLSKEGFRRFAREAKIVDNRLSWDDLDAVYAASSGA